MPPRSDTFDLARLRLSAGEGRRLDLHAGHDPFDLSGERYIVEPALVPVRVDVSRLTGGGYSLRLRFAVRVTGPCMRCLRSAAPQVEVDAREVDKPGEGDELDSPYLDAGVLDVHSWMRDALALALPAQLLCRDDCAGLCPECGADLNAAGPEHHHEPGRDPRWAALDQLRFD